MNPRTMQHHNCMQQALVAERVCTISKEHARKEEDNEVRRSLELDCVGKPRSSMSSPSQWAPHSTSSFSASWPFISSIMRDLQEHANPRVL